MSSLETLIRRVTTAINGQYPRPWMTDLTNPAEADVCVVGYNPATAYEVGTVDYERHVDALFNRNGENCRRFYGEVTPGTPSRDNIEMFAQKLAQTGVVAVMETNVVCYATKSKSDLRKPEHAGGKERGIEIFRALIEEIRFKAIVVHGKGVSKEFSKALNLPPSFPSPPDDPNRFATYDVPRGPRVLIIPSLALPGFQNWPKAPLRSFCNWADGYLTKVAANVADTVRAAQRIRLEIVRAKRSHDLNSSLNRDGPQAGRPLAKAEVEIHLSLVPKEPNSSGKKICRSCRF